MILKANSRFVPLKDKSVQCVITSPPYWGLRKYDDACNRIWDGDDDCEHEWQLYHEKPKGGQHKHTKPNVGANIMLQKSELRQHGYDSLFCQSCNAWYGQLGLEPTYQLYLQHLKIIIDEIYRVLRDDGSFWLNIGDTYAGPGCGRGDYRENKSLQRDIYEKPNPQLKVDIKPKSLIGIPERIMLMMIDSGWILRNKCIWHKPNSMPSSAKDRFNNTFEYVYFFAKKGKYYSNLDAVREEHQFDGRKDTLYKGGQKDMSIGKHERWANPQGKNPGEVMTEEEYRNWYFNQREKGGWVDKNIDTLQKGHQKTGLQLSPPDGKNPGDFWIINTEPYPKAHYATFPKSLVAKILSFATRPGDVVLDPFAGSGTVGEVCLKMGRKSMLIDLAYHDLMTNRMGLFR